MILIQAHFLLEVLTKQCPNMSNNAGIISSVSPPHLFLYLSRDSECQSLLQAAKGVFLIFNLTYSLRLQKIAVSVTLECVLLCFFCASYQARVSVIRSALYWFGHSCVACISSHWGPVHTRGALPHQCPDEKYTMPFVSEKQRLLWIHHFMVHSQILCCI